MIPFNLRLKELVNQKKSWLCVGLDMSSEALNNNEIAAAALDTTKIEPLENSSPLWNTPNCFISAHDSAHSLLSIPRAFSLFAENIKNIKNGDQIVNLYSE